MHSADHAVATEPSNNCDIKGAGDSGLQKHVLGPGITLNTLSNSTHGALQSKPEVCSKTTAVTAAINATDVPTSQSSPCISAGHGLTSNTPAHKSVVMAAYPPVHAFPPLSLHDVALLTSCALHDDDCDGSDLSISVLDGPEHSTSGTATSESSSNLFNRVAHVELSQPAQDATQARTPPYHLHLQHHLPRQRVHRPTVGPSMSASEAVGHHHSCARIPHSTHLAPSGQHGAAALSPTFVPSLPFHSQSRAQRSLPLLRNRHANAALFRHATIPPPPSPVKGGQPGMRSSHHIARLLSAPLPERPGLSGRRGQHRHQSHFPRHRHQPSCHHPAHLCHPRPHHSHQQPGNFTTESQGGCQGLSRAASTRKERGRGSGRGEAPQGVRAGCLPLWSWLVGKRGQPLRQALHLGYAVHEAEPPATLVGHNTCAACASMSGIQQQGMQTSMCSSEGRALVPQQPLKQAYTWPSSATTFPAATTALSENCKKLLSALFSRRSSCPGQSSNQCQHQMNLGKLWRTNQATAMSDIAEFMLNTPWGSDYGPRTATHMMPCMRPVLSETGWPRMRALSLPSVPTLATAKLDKGQRRSLQYSLSLNATLIPSRLSQCSK